MEYHSHVIITGISVDLSRKEGNTLLQVASAFGQEQIVDLVLQKGGNIDKVNQFGWTALMQAVRNGHSSTVKQLIEQGADIGLTNRYGTITKCFSLYGM